MEYRIASMLEFMSRSDAGPVPDVYRDGETLFLSVSDGRQRARTVHVNAGSLEAAGRRLPALQDLWPGIDVSRAWVRIDRVVQVLPVNWGQALRLLQGTKTNYFSLGLAWDARLETAFLPEELWGNACLYTGNIDECQPNEENLRALATRRDGVSVGWPADESVPFWLFSTQAVFQVAGGAPVQRLADEGPLHRLRNLDTLDAAILRDAITNSADYLARQVTATGGWVYGRYPCFDRLVPSYNVLRYATAAYSLLDAWELTQRPEHLQAAQRALDALCEYHIHPLFGCDGETDASYLVDVDDEVKLGGNGVAIVALAKLVEVCGDRRYVPVVRALANGLLRMQVTEDGSFPHVLRFPTMDIVEQHRTIYYDGEALFGLLKAYELTEDARYLDAARHAADHFVRQEHWRAHDHWLAYGLNELTRYEPDPRYFRLALRNVGRHVRFINDRLTAYPTLLELCMASRSTLARMKAIGLSPEQVDPGFSEETVDAATHTRARRLFSAHFFPELAMFFRSPGDIVGSFAIRHFSFRIRIDDVQHFLCGLVAYHREFLRESPERHRWNASVKGAPSALIH